MDRDELLSQHLSDISDHLSSPEPPANVEDALRITLNYSPRSNNDRTKEVLQSFIENLPPEGSQVVCRYILQHNDQDSLQGLADHLLKTILAPMRACGGQTPVTSNSPFGNADDITSEMVEASTRASLRLIKPLCLRRDNFHCVLSRRFAKEALGQYTEIPDSEIRKHMLTAHISHIIPFALDPWSNDTEAKKKSNTWTTMFSLFPGLDSVMKPEHINAGQNLMILSNSLNHEFGSLELALEPTDDEHTYKIIMYDNFSGSEADYFPPPDKNGNRFIKLQHHGGPLALPSRALLGTHAAVARILHASGMAEVIDRVLENAVEKKEKSILKPD